MRSRVAWVGAALVVLVSGCGGAALPAADSGPASPKPAVVLEVSGSGTASPLVKALAAAWTSEHPEVDFTFLDGINSGGALRGVREGTLDLAVVNRPLTSEESSSGVVYTAVAREPLAFVVGDDRPGLTGVTTDQVRDIYAGRLTQWSALGAGTGRLLVLDRDPDESARKLGLLPLLAPDTVTAATTVLTKAGEMGSALEGTPGAFGYSAVGFMALTGVTEVQLLALDGVAPTPQNVVAGTYPLSLTFGLVHDKQASPSLVEFVRWTQGAVAHNLMQAAGYAIPAP